jgi:hypothetical protein
MNYHFLKIIASVRPILAGMLILVNFYAKAADPELRQKGVRISTFDINATPPVESFLAYGNAAADWDMGLRARGIVLLGAGQPIVLCSVDWIGIGNEGHDEFCYALARAAGTSPERVAVHTVHQHDTPWCDFGAERILKAAGFDPTKYDGTFNREVISRLEVAVKKSLTRSTPVTSVGYGVAKVNKVASNRRVFGPDGRIMEPRLSACEDSVLRNKPEGLIDPMISVISFWNNKQPVAVLSYYAVHPQSYYRTGITNPDFPGIARFMRQLEVPQALHIHFNGAGGNITAGKYNDGSPENRGILAKRLADGMKKAWETSVRMPVDSGSIRWDVEPIFLPPAKNLIHLQDGTWSSDSLLVKCYAARLAWLKRCQAGKKINLSCLTIGKIRILHLPGEPFIEYQLAAKAERKDLFVTVAGYGDSGPGYIGTAIAYKQGGYETSHVSNVTPEAETILKNGIFKLLHK